MERVTVRMPEKDLAEVEQRTENGEFPNRSEAIRSAIRGMLKANGVSITPEEKRNDGRQPDLQVPGSSKLKERTEPPEEVVYSTKVSR